MFSGYLAKQKWHTVQTSTELLNATLLACLPHKALLTWCNNWPHEMMINVYKILFNTHGTVPFKC
jgi:hypothetical protein